MRTYFHKEANTSIVHKAIVYNDRRLTPLNLCSKSPQKSETHIDLQKKEQWKQKKKKTLHGRHFNDLHQQQIDTVASNTWLKIGDIFPETEEFMLAIQDQVIETRNYQKYISNKNSKYVNRFM